MDKDKQNQLQSNHTQPQHQDDIIKVSIEDFIHKLFFCLFSFWQLLYECLESRCLFFSLTKTKKTASKTKFRIFIFVFCSYANKIIEWK